MTDFADEGLLRNAKSLGGPLPSGRVTPYRAASRVTEPPAWWAGRLRPSGHGRCRDPRCQTARNIDPQSASNIGSDSHLMIFDVDVVLFSKRNQHNGRSFAFIFIGAVRIDR